MAIVYRSSILTLIQRYQSKPLATAALKGLVALGCNAVRHAPRTLAVPHRNFTVTGKLASRSASNTET